MASNTSRNDNPMGTTGFAFVEFCSPTPEYQINQLRQLGFQLTARHRTKKIELYEQGSILFFINIEPGFATTFASIHGPGVCSIGFMLENALRAQQLLMNLKAPFLTEKPSGLLSDQLPILQGVGESLIYLVDEGSFSEILAHDFIRVDAEVTAPTGLTYIDHLTHNLVRGDMDIWVDYYHTYFNFKQIRYFDIKGAHTGLVSRAMASPDGHIRIPLNEGTEEASQIEEFLREFNGAGIQHIALGTNDIYSTIENMRQNGLKFLAVPNTYYEALPKRIPWQQEDLKRMQKNAILIDDDGLEENGLLLQIFTETMLGPVFFEIIQRKGNQGFGEGNFQALFNAIEQDQMQRGVL